MSFKAWGGLISRDIIPHKGTRFYSPLRSHGQIRLSRFGFLTSTELLTNWFSCSCNRWKCVSTLFWRSSSTVVMLRSAWSVWFETYHGAPAFKVCQYEMQQAKYETPPVNSTGSVRITWYWNAFTQPLLRWKSSKYYIFWVWVYMLSYPAWYAHAPN